MNCFIKLVSIIYLAREHSNEDECKNKGCQGKNEHEYALHEA